MKQDKPRGLFLNVRKAGCSIYESGRMAYEALLPSEAFTLDYAEITEITEEVAGHYDFYLFNYHPWQSTRWVDTTFIRPLFRAPCFTLVLEISPDNPFVYVSPHDFDAYLVLDPTIRRQHGVYPFPRPLEEVACAPAPEHAVPVIGTFGFATLGKGFDKLISAVNREFDAAVIKINLPVADFVPEDIASAVLASIERERQSLKPGVTLEITRDFMSKDEIAAWCSRNTLNCFFYDRESAGLAAATDQAIASGRPLLVTDNPTFRHILQYTLPYPKRSLREAIATSQTEVAAMQRDWHPRKFAERFEKLLQDFEIKTGQGLITGSATIPLVPTQITRLERRRTMDQRESDLAQKERELDQLRKHCEELQEQTGQVWNKYRTERKELRSERKHSEALVSTLKKGLDSARQWQRTSWIHRALHRWRLDGRTQQALKLPLRPVPSGTSSLDREAPENVASQITSPGVGAGSLDAWMNSLLGLKEPLPDNYLADFYAKPFDQNPLQALNYCFASYSQAGEDRIICNLFHLMGIFTPTYLDIGACHPVFHSNTFLFDRIGSKGVAVEPNPAFTPLYALCRPNCKMIPAGVCAGEQTEADYYDFGKTSSGLNTFDKETASSYVRLGYPRPALLRLPIITVTSILEKHFESGLDLLSLDAEGLDVAILNEWDFKRYRPKVICVENIEYLTDKDENAGAANKFSMLTRAGFKPVASTRINQIFVEEESWDRCRKI